ncbi:MAG: DNA-3-methyladenine glycosylase I [Bdellovibrionota bacterium]
MKARIRCAWANSQELFIPYHDEEWGVPVRKDDRLLFEMLNLEGAQAGLSWLVILRKRDGYRKAFANFDMKKVARFGARKRAQLVKFEGIVRHAGKISAVVDNAKAALAVRKEFGSFAAYLWGFTGGKSLKGNGRPGPECKALAKDLKKRGFRFVGETTVYAFMQAVGMVNDHSPECFRSRK